MKDISIIIKECAEGVAESQRAFYEKYLSYALKIAYRYVGTYENAADAANDAFVRIFKAIRKFEIQDAANAEKMLLGWMRKIVINVSIDYMKKESLMTAGLSSVNEVLPASQTNYTADNQLMYKELISLIRHLSPAYKVVFNLHVIDGYSHQEIAGMLGISEGTSKSNLSKAKTVLKKFLIEDRKGNALCFT